MSRTIIVAAVVILVALVVAWAYIATRPQKTWLGQTVEDFGGLPALIAAL